MGTIAEIIVALGFALVALVFLSPWINPVSCRIEDRILEALERARRWARAEQQAVLGEMGWPKHGPRIVAGAMMKR